MHNENSSFVHIFMDIRLHIYGAIHLYFSIWTVVVLATFKLIQNEIFLMIFL